MWKRITRQPIACLAIFAAIVLAGCPETANVDDSAPTVLGTLPPVTVEGAGKAVSVPLAGAFRAAEGEKLSYAAKSSNTTVAVVKVAGATLTITSGSAGTAIITVTATDTKKRSATQYLSITVSVPPTTTTTPPPTTPTTPTTPEPQEDCTLSGSSLTNTIRIIRENSKKCTLPTGHSLLYSSSEGKVRVGRPAKSAPDVWTITALKKGRPVVQVRKDSDGTTVGEITVIVPNTPPQLRIGTIDSTAYNGTIDGTFTAAKSGSLTLSTLSITNLFAQFDDDDDVDKDTTGGVFNYKVSHNPDELLIKIHDGFLLDENKSGDFDPIDVVVLKALKEPNKSIEVYAYDRSNDRSDNPVEVNFAASVRSITYNLTKGTGNTYKKLKVGNRIGVPHTINLMSSDAPTYDFINDFITPTIVGNEVKKIDSNGSDTYSLDSDICDPKKGPPTSISTATKAGSQGQGDGCWSVKISGSDVILGTFDHTAKTVQFTLDEDRGLNNANDFTITIGYYVVVENEAAKDPDINKVDEKSLTVNVHSCTEVDDCP